MEGLAARHLVKQDYGLAKVLLRRRPMDYRLLPEVLRANDELFMGAMLDAIAGGASVEEVAKNIIAYSKVASRSSKDIQNMASKIPCFAEALTDNAKVQAFFNTFSMPCESMARSGKASLSPLRDQRVLVKTLSQPSYAALVSGEQKGQTMLPAAASQAESGPDVEAM